MEFQQTTNRHEPLPANQQLSEEYRQFKTLDRVEPALINRSAQAISSCQIDIRQHFAQHGSLENLRAIGIGKRVKTDLSIILDSGIEKAVECRKRAHDAGTTDAPQADMDLRSFHLGLERERRRLTE
jgi:hypothetical protein